MRGDAHGLLRRVLRLTALLAGLALAAALLAGCTTDAPATGIARVDKRTIAAYKPCGKDPGDQGIGRIDVYGSDNPDKPMWTAIHTDGEPSTLQMPITHRYPGYVITDERHDNHLDRIQTYSVEAVSLDGKAWGGPSFRTTQLEAGHVRVAGRQLHYAAWISSPETCPDVGILGALLTGLVVAAVAGGALLGARGLRALSRRGRRAP